MARATHDKVRKERVRTEKDFINAPEYGDSMKKLLAANDEKSLTHAAVCKYLMVSRAELDSIQTTAMIKLRRGFSDG